MRLVHVLFALLVNAIPAYGVFALGWSVGTLLILFWLDNLLGVLAMGLRLALHQTRSGDPAYDDPKQWTEMTVNGKSVRVKEQWKGYLMIALPFALAHGVFALMLPFAFSQQGGEDATLWRPTWDALKIGGGLIVATLVLDLLVDLPGLARPSFNQVKRAADSRFARVLVLHVVLIFGAMAVNLFDSPYGMLGVMIGLKALVDVGVSLGSHDAERGIAPRAGVGTDKSAQKGPR